MLTVRTPCRWVAASWLVAHISCGSFPSLLALPAGHGTSRCMSLVLAMLLLLPLVPLLLRLGSTLSSRLCRRRLLLLRLLLWRVDSRQLPLPPRPHALRLGCSWRC